MIRPPSTSISLSANDISFHLQHVEIYHGLLKQGFKKRDIQRYLRQQKEAIAKEVCPSDYSATAPAQRLLEVICRKTTNEEPKSKGTSQAPFQEIIRDERDLLIIGNRSDYSSHGYCAGAQNGSLTSTAVTESLLPNKPETSVLTNDCCRRVSIQSETTISESGLHRHHAPRQSSLLRFSSNLSSEQDADTYSSTTIPFSSLPQIPRRLQKQALSHEQFEAGDNKSSDSSLISDFDHLMLDESLVLPTVPDHRESRLRPDAREFTPQRAFSDAFEDRHDVDRSYLLTDEGFKQPMWNLPTAITSRIIPTLRNHRSSHISSAASIQRRTSSSSSSIGREEKDRDLQSSSPTLPPMPFTPSHQHLTSNARTEPREIRARYLDGQSFTPYNDFLPAEVQPQTPADLSRHPLLGELNAAYTAPPGRLRNEPSRNRTEYQFDTQGGEQSPTNRAINMRQRRNREYARSARIEGLRINRLRERYRAIRDSAQDRESRHDDIWDIDDHLNLWRDDLDADRAGEENFEDNERTSNMAGVGMRVLSGNRRVHDL